MQLDDYKHLIDSQNLHKDLVKHFSYLADNKEFKPVLKKIFKEAHSVAIEDDNLAIHFRGDKKLRCSAPGEISKYKKWPKAFQKCVSKHEYISFPDESALNLGNLGLFETEYLAEGDDEYTLCPITEYSDWWLYHPTKKTSTKQNALCFLSHNGGEVEEPTALGVGSRFLERMVSIMGLDIDIPEINDNALNVEKLHKLWSELSQGWQTIFRDSNDIDSEKDLTDKDILTIINCKTIRSYDSKITLDNLEPLKMLENLQELSLSVGSIEDVSAISNLLGLKNLTLVGVNITNIDLVFGLKKLEYLEVCKTPLENIQGVASLTKLKRLKIKQTNVSDLSPVVNLKKLESIDISESKVVDLSPIGKLESLSELNCKGSPISDLTPLKELKRVGVLNLDNTNITTLEPLYNVKGIFILHCKNTAISFKELLQFVNSDFYEYTIGHHIGLEIYSDKIHSYKLFLDEIKVIDYPLNDLAKVLAFFVNRQIINLLKNKKKEEAENLLTSFLAHAPFVIEEKQEFFANVLALITTSNNRELQAKAIEHLMPESIDNSTVAFNLACFYSVQKDRESLFKYSKLALSLGHEAERFRQDSDFKGYIEDDEFIEILDASYIPDPNIDPAAWWNQLDDEWQSEIGSAMPEYPTCKEDIKNIKSIKKFICHDKTNIDNLRYLTSIEEVEIRFSKLTSIDVLKYLSKLTYLKIDGDNYSSSKKIRSIEPLRDLPNLETVIINNEEIEDLSPIESKTSIEIIRLHNLQLVKSINLEKLPNLQGLYLMLPNIESIVGLDKCKNLGSLHITNWLFDSLEIIKNFKELSEINIDASKIKDISILSELKELEEISLHNLGNVSLEPLNNLTELLSLNIENTEIPEDVIKAFIKNNPKCEVEYSTK